MRMPEGWAPTFVQTECLIRHLRPDVRSVKQAPGVKRCYHYITEHGVLPPECGITDDPAAWRLKALCATRSYCLWLNKGIDALHYFDAYEEKAGSFGVLPTNLRHLTADVNFEDAATTPMRAIRNLVHAFRGSVALPKTDPLRIEVVALGPQSKVFDGDAAHPPLWERDLLAVLPFQIDRDRHVIAVYVMSRDAVKPFPPARFRVKFTGVKGKEVEAVDVLTGAPVNFRANDLGGDGLELTLDATDAPQLIRIGH